MCFHLKKGVQLTLLIAKMAFYNIYYNVIFLKILNCCYDVGVLLNMSCAIPMWQTIYHLFKFNEFKDAFLVDFVAMVKKYQYDGYPQYFDLMRCF